MDAGRRPQLPASPHRVLRVPQRRPGPEGQKPRVRALSGGERQGHTEVGVHGGEGRRGGRSRCENDGWEYPRKSQGNFHLRGLHKSDQAVPLPLAYWLHANPLACHPFLSVLQDQGDESRAPDKVKHVVAAQAVKHVHDHKRVSP